MKMKMKMKMKLCFFLIFVNYFSSTINFVYACSVGVIDAGSTGTRLNIFQFINNKINTVSVIQQKGGIDTIPYNFLGIYLKNLIERANFPTSIPLIFNSTAGMRKLNKLNSNKILEKVREEMRGYNLIENKVIKGEIEAYYTLKSIEYAVPEIKEFIIIDMGGKSVQIIEKNEYGHSVKSYEIGILDYECLLAQENNKINETYPKKDENNKNIIKYSYNELINGNNKNNQIELKKQNLKSIINNTFQNLFNLKNQNDINNYNELKINNNQNQCNLNTLGNENQCNLNTSGNENQCNLNTSGNNNQCNLNTSDNENQCNLNISGNENQCNLNILGNNNQCNLNTLGNENQCNLNILGNENQCNLNTLGNENQCNLNTSGNNNQWNLMNILNNSKRCNMDQSTNSLNFSIEANKQDQNRRCVINIYNLPNVNSIVNYNIFSNSNELNNNKQMSLNGISNNNIEVKNIDKTNVNEISKNKIKQNMLENLQNVIFGKYCKWNINNYNKIKPLENIEKDRPIFLLSIFNDLFGSENNDKTLENIENEYQNVCNNQLTKTCKEKLFLISFLKKMGFKQNQRFKIVKYLNKVDITWSYGKAIDFCEKNTL